jgi:hypothetical protein
VFHRLYEQAIALRSKLDHKRVEVKREELENIQVSTATQKLSACTVVS